MSDQHQHAAEYPRKFEVIDPREAIHEMREAALLTQAAAERTAQLAEEAARGPRWETRAFSSAQSIHGMRSREGFRSLTILNPTTLAVYIGLAGASAQPTNRVPSVPPLCFLTLPTEAWDIELGVDPTLVGASTFVVYVGFWPSLQPMAAGKLA